VYGPENKPPWTRGSTTGIVKRPQNGSSVLGRARNPELAEANERIRQKAANKKAAYNKRGQILGVVKGESKEEATVPARPERSIRVIPLDGMKMKDAKDLLSRLALGDRTALSACGIDPASEPDIQGHEWGLGQQGSRFCLVSGAEGEIDWSKVTGYTAIAHTHPAQAIDSKAIADTLTAGSIGQALKIWADQSSSAPASVRSLNEMPGHLWYLFPSNSDISSGYLAAAAFPQRVYTPFRYGPGGWPSATEGPEIVVDYGPGRAVLNEDWAQTVLANPGLGAEAIEALCIRYFMAAVTFLTVDGIVVLHRGVLRCAADSARGAGTYSGSGAWYFDQSYDMKSALTRTNVLKGIREKLGTN
jgi:hypothetical protein